MGLDVPCGGRCVFGAGLGNSIGAQHDTAVWMSVGIAVSDPTDALPVIGEVVGDWSVRPQTARLHQFLDARRKNRVVQIGMIDASVKLAPRVRCAVLAS